MMNGLQPITPRRYRAHEPLDYQHHCFIPVIRAALDKADGKLIGA